MPQSVTIVVGKLTTAVGGIMQAFKFLSPQSVVQAQLSVP